jgi:hypothetical protein
MSGGSVKKKGRMVTVESNSGRKPMHLDLDKGALHEQLGVSQKKKIPVSKLQAAKARAKRTGNTKLERRANFALVARSWKH